MELARSGGAIGSHSCSGRRGRGDPIACSCTARPCTQSGGETEVRIELRILPHARHRDKPSVTHVQSDTCKRARTTPINPNRLHPSSSNGKRCANSEADLDNFSDISHRSENAIGSPRIFRKRHALDKCARCRKLFVAVRDR